jgi:23S rRNA (cytidine1920-2'-O)/16S rRNA (cytidine1409-2'-O)-methyltransferase
MTKKRLDIVMVERGLSKSRSHSARLIQAGEVFVNGQLIDKPAAKVEEDAEIHLMQDKYVSRGGYKLEHALKVFQIDIKGKKAIDVGASTGGFTDCLLQRGVSKVWAVDVGKGQLDWKLRNDPRVVVLEGVNARYLSPQIIGEEVDLATVDVSFISLKLILPPLKKVVRKGGDIIALVKPQFEAGRAQVKKGVVRDPKVWLAVLKDLVKFALSEGLLLGGATPSPLKGPAGNIEFFLHLKNYRGK